MGFAMILGTWSAKSIIERMPCEKFQRYATGHLVAVAVYMVVRG